MKQLKQILAGVTFRPEDGELSEGSRKAARQAAWVARKNRGALLLLHSTHADESGDKGGGRDIEEAAQAARGALEPFVAELSAEGTNCTYDVCPGKAWREITRRVMERSVDLVVVGKRNDAEVEGPRLGSLAMKLIRSCPGPVWAVRPEHDLTIRLVLAVSDLSPVGDEACRTAAWIAAENQSELHLLHAFTPPSEDELRADLPVSEQAAAIRERAKRRMLGAVDSSRLAHEPVTHLVKGKPSAAVREAVEHLGPDLLVMGAVSRGADRGHLLGDTAERVLARVGCSVLTLKPANYISPLASAGA